MLSFDLYFVFRGDNRKANLKEAGSGEEKKSAHSPLPDEVTLVLRLSRLRSPSLCLITMEAVCVLLNPNMSVSHLT